MQPLHLQETVKKSEKFSVYDSVDEEVINNYNEFQLASLVFFALKESATSEQSSRMTAMEGASKNAGLYSFLFAKGFNITLMSF